MSDERETTDQVEISEPRPDARRQFVIRWLRSGAPAPYTCLSHNRMSLGRSEAAEIQFSASGISRVHAEIHRQGPVYAISDQGSRNGTYVNGERIRHRALAPNDVLRLGVMVGVVMQLPGDVDLAQEDLVELDPKAVFGPGLRSELALLRQTAKTNLPVVFAGETGVGKESLARSVHRFSQKQGPFHAVNCAALPVTLAEAELFGHKKGAFTGADQGGRGHFRAAHGGTLFLDELGDLPLPIQAKLLRVLQDYKVTPVGETDSVDIDVRVVTACQASLEDLVQTGRLREDLMMRLSGVTIKVPPLRERRVDIGFLVDHFFETWNSDSVPELDASALEALLLHAWPGNVRQLELTLRNVLALHGSEPVILPSMLPPFLGSRTENQNFQLSTESPPSTQSRREHDFGRLVSALRANGGSITGAAKTTGISRQRAYRLMQGRAIEDLLATPAAGNGARGNGAHGNGVDED